MTVASGFSNSDGTGATESRRQPCTPARPGWNCRRRLKRRCLARRCQGWLYWQSWAPIAVWPDAAAGAPSAACAGMLPAYASALQEPAQPQTSASQQYVS